MIDELLELTSFTEQFEELFMKPMHAELKALEEHKLFLEPLQQKKRDEIIKRIDFMKSFTISIKTTQELAAMGRILALDFVEGVETMKLTKPDGSFRPTLLAAQTDFLKQYYEQAQAFERETGLQT
jgi:hypothetical protein